MGVHSILPMLSTVKFVWGSCHLSFVNISFYFIDGKFKNQIEQQAVENIFEIGLNL